MQTDSSKYATIEIMQYNPNEISYRTVWISEEEWKSISYVDYIEIDSLGNLLPEFEAYSPIAQATMLSIIKNKVAA